MKLEDKDIQSAIDKVWDDFSGASKGSTYG